MSSRDVVVIGAGHQGLVAAVTLAEAGLDVEVVEASEEIGGAVRSRELIRPGLTHDLYATNMNLFLGSPFFAKHSDELTAAGLGFAHSQNAYASAFPGGTSLRVSMDADATLAMWEAHDPRDAAGWQRLFEIFTDMSATYLPLASHPFPSASTVGVARQVLLRRKHTTLAELVQVLASSTRALGDRYFATPEARSLAAAWGMHLDFAPDVAAGAIFPLLELFLDAQVGMSIVAGGASNLPRAIAQLLEARGGSLRTGDPVERIELADRRVKAVRLASGERIETRLGVISTATLPALVNRLLAGQALPASLRTGADNFRFGPGTFMLHLALSGPIPWEDERLASSAYVHVGPYVDDMARAYQQALAGILPDEPLLVVGQTSVVDPSRSAGAGEAVWIQARTFPGTIRGDSTPTAAGGDLSGSDWDAAADPVAHRILAKLESYAPGVSDLVLGHAAHSPADLERANPNLVGGDSISGSHHLDQFIGLRPSLALSRYRTPVGGLYLAGAGTWPGGGVNAVSGQRAAESLLRATSGRRLAGKIGRRRP